MPLMKSCCCFKSIRNGSFASAIYTMVFYVIVMTACTFHIHSVFNQIATYGLNVQLWKLMNNMQNKEFKFVEKMFAFSNSLEMLAFTLVLICLSAVMVITSILLLIGLCADNGQLFVPWMVTIFLTTLSDVLLALYLLYHSTMDPFRAVIFVFDFFICGVNVFCFLCIYSYYQQCKRDMLHLKYLAPQQNAKNNFTDLKKYDGSNHLDIRNLDLNNKKYKYSLEQHLAYKNSHFVELSTISEDNEQNISEKNAMVAKDETRHMIVADYGSDSSQMVTLLTCIESGLVSPSISSSAKLEESIIDVKHSESVV